MRRDGAAVETLERGLIYVERSPKRNLCIAACAGPQGVSAAGSDRVPAATVVFGPGRGGRQGGGRRGCGGNRVRAEFPRRALQRGGAAVDARAVVAGGGAGRRLVGAAPSGGRGSLRPVPRVPAAPRVRADLPQRARLGDVLAPAG